jgi:hypothetical protein
VSDVRVLTTRHVRLGRGPSPRPATWTSRVIPQRLDQLLYAAGGDPGAGSMSRPRWSGSPGAPTALQQPVRDVRDGAHPGCHPRPASGLTSPVARAAQLFFLGVRCANPLIISRSKIRGRRCESLLERHAGNRHNVTYGPLRSPSSRSDHFEGSRGGRLTARRQPAQDETAQLSRHLIHTHPSGREPIKRPLDGSSLARVHSCRQSALGTIDGCPPIREP